MHARLEKHDIERISDHNIVPKLDDEGAVLSSAIGRRYESFWHEDEDTVDESRPDGTHSIIDVLSSQLKNRVIPQYLDEFEVVIPEAEVVVGAVPLEEIQQREEQVEEARLRQIELESDLYRQREIQLAQQEARARERLLQEARRRHAELVQKGQQAAEAMQYRARRIKHVYRQAESHLADTLKKQEARVAQLYGSLMPSGVPQSRKRYRVEWARIPLLIRIRGRMLNAVKDKLPLGQYVMVATLYDRLGGHALHWTKWDPEVPVGATSRTATGRPNFTRPFHHGGRFYHTEVTLNQDMYVVCPPQIELRPGNTLVFELFQLSQSTVASYAMAMPRSKQKMGESADQCGAMPTDHVVAWGALPLTTPDFQVVQGQYKLPLLRGGMDHTMEKYRDMEKMYQSDLSSWLCNFYFQVNHLPNPPTITLLRATRNRSDEDEAFDAEIDEHGGLVRLLVPELENNSQRYMRKMSSGLPNQSTMRKRSGPSTIHSDTERSEEEHVNSGTRAAGKRLLATTTSDNDNTALIHPKKPIPNSIRRNLISRWKRWLVRFSPTKKTRVYSGDVIPTLQDRSLPHKSMLSKGTKECESLLDGQKDGHRLDANILPDFFENDDEDAEVSQDSDKIESKRNQQLDFENYTYSVNAAGVMDSARHQRFHTQRKLHYLRHELLVDLGFSNWYTLEFWRLVTMLLLTCWVRVYVHYVTQWLFLRGNRIPVYDFQPRWTTCLVKYTWQSVATHTEIGLLLVGVLGNAFVFTILSALAASCQRFVGELPAFGSNFIVCVGIATVLDPFLILLVDVLSHHYECSQVSECSVSLTASRCTCVTGDWFKLYVRFQTQEGSGLVGLLIVFILYSALTCLTLLALYIYLLYIHMNGRMLDVYRRVHGEEEAFFVPHDAEVSLQELQAVCAQASRWKGPRGTQRKVFVHEYALTDPLDPLYRETNTHVAVYNVELDGTRQLHRHFLKMPDGAVLELFGKLGARVDGNWKSDTPQGIRSHALLFKILKDVQQAGNSTLEPLAGLVDEL